MSPASPPVARRRPPPDDSTSDETLLVGLGRGDSDASYAFVDRYQRRVYGLALKIMGDPTQAEEIAQDALIRAWEKAGAYDPRLGSVSSWLLTITRNLAIDALRKRRAQPTDPSDALFSELPASSSEPVDVAIAAEDIDRVRVALLALTEEQRRALLLAAFYGLSAREISEAESIPLGTAKSRIRSGLIKMRSLLDTEPPSDEGEADITLELIRSSSAGV